MLLPHIFTLTLLASTSALPFSTVERAMPRPGATSISILRPTTRVLTDSPVKPACGRQGGVCTDEERQALLRRQAERYRADRAAYLAEQEAKAKREANRKRDACRADSAWTAKVKGLSLSATGSDVDEIYGAISVSSDVTASISSSYHNYAEGWGANELWASKRNTNIGRGDVKSLSTVTISSIGRGFIHILLYLFDEDDGRGGVNDEFFYMDGRQSRDSNYHAFKFDVPDCNQPEFQRIWSTVIVGRTRPPSNDQVFLHVHVEASRFYPAGKP